ncbi:MAG: hypothetical protein QXQ40_01665 [Candidatus Aenigmatarchaeota archaeon]
MGTEEKLSQGWLKVWFAIELMATNKEFTEKVLKEHVENLSKAKNVLVLEKDFKSVEKVKNPPKNVQEAYSQVVEVKLLVKDLFTLINIIIAYGPSAIEILEPNEKRIRIDEIQNIANTIASLIHQFAQAGVGGIVISPSK